MFGCGRAVPARAAGRCASSPRIVSMADSRVRVIADFGRRHRRLRLARLIAQHPSYLLKDAFAPSHALKIAFSQSAPEDRVVIRHFSRDGAASCGQCRGHASRTPHSINLSAGCEAVGSGSGPVTLFGALTHASWIATLRAAQELVMSDTPIRRDPPKLDRAVAAHERRTRLIAQLHEQAVAAAKDLSSQHKGIRADIAKDARRQRAEAWL